MATLTQVAAHSLSSVGDGRSLNLVTPQGHGFRFRSQTADTTAPEHAATIATVDTAGVHLVSGSKPVVVDASFSRDGIDFNQGATSTIAAGGTNASITVEAPESTEAAAVALAAPAGGITVTGGQAGLDLTATGGKVRIGVASSGVSVGSNDGNEDTPPTNIFTDVVLPHSKRIYWGTDPANPQAGDVRMGPETLGDGTKAFVHQMYHEGNWVELYCTHP